MRVYFRHLRNCSSSNRNVYSSAIPSLFTYYYLYIVFDFSIIVQESGNCYSNAKWIELFRQRLWLVSLFANQKPVSIFNNNVMLNGTREKKRKIPKKQKREKNQQRRYAARSKEKQQTQRVKSNNNQNRRDVTIDFKPFCLLHFSFLFRFFFFSLFLVHSLLCQHVLWAFAHCSSRKCMQYTKPHWIATTRENSKQMQKAFCLSRFGVYHQ